MFLPIQIRNKSDGYAPEQRVHNSYIKLVRQMFIFLPYCSSISLGYNQMFDILHNINLHWMPFHLISLFVSIFIAFLPPSTKYNDTNGWILAPMFYDLWSRCVFCAYNAWLLLNNYKAYPINNLMRTLFFFLYWNCCETATDKIYLFSCLWLP